MPLAALPRARAIRGVAVVVITGSVALGAACSDEDTVDTIPPPRPGHTTTLEGPGILHSPAPSTTRATKTTSTSSHPTTTAASPTGTATR